MLRRLIGRLRLRMVLGLIDDVLALLASESRILEGFDLRHLLALVISGSQVLKLACLLLIVIQALTC